MKRLEAARKKEAEADAATRAERLRREAMNRKAYEACAPVWRDIRAQAGAASSAAASGSGDGWKRRSPKPTGETEF